MSEFFYTPHATTTTPEPRRERRRKGDARFPLLRVRQLERIITDHHGARLPDDDDGRDFLRVVAHHLAQVDQHRIERWALKWLPEIAPDELEELIAQAGKGWRWGADELAHEIGLDDAMRKRLKVTTIGAIDCDKVQRARRRKRKRKAADRVRRAKAGAKPRAKSAENLMPWNAEGISRRTWYRRRAQELALNGTDARPANLSSPMRSEISEKSNPHKRPKGAARSEATTSGSATGSGEADGANASTITAKPLSSSNPRPRPAPEPSERCVSAAGATSRPGNRKAIQPAGRAEACRAMSPLCASIAAAIGAGANDNPSAMLSGERAEIAGDLRRAPWHGLSSVPATTVPNKRKKPGS